MSARVDDPRASFRREMLAGIARRAAQIVIMFLVQGIALFLAAGSLAWVWGWVFLAIYLGSVLINSVFMLRSNPDTVAERGQAKGMKSWDKLIGGLWSLAQFLGLPIVAGLDARLGWSGQLGDAWHIGGAVAFAAGLGLFGWAMITNAFFSTAARIQADRGQTVCREGPYRIVRHPGYLGAIVQSLSIPFLLGSWWSLVPGITAGALMAVRTWLEDRMLQEELPGYNAFAKDVRNRLLPGIW